MALWKDNIKAEDLKQGTTAEITSTFCFKMSDKAITPDQAVSLNLDAPKKGTVWPVDMCNTRLDRHNEIFTKPVLDEFAKQINANGITFNLFHDRELGVGRVLKSATVTMETDGTYTLKGYVWIKDVNIPELDYPVAEAITDGIYKDVSVEVSGSVRYIENPQGGYGVWEYYIDPERPDRTEISGLALVQKGAQRGAGIVKSINGGSTKPAPTHVNNTTMTFDKEYEAGGKSHRVYTDKAADGTITLKGMNEAIEAHKAAEVAKSKAETDKVTAETLQKSAEAETAVLKAAIVTELSALQLALKMTTPKTVAELEALKAADLLTMRTDLHKQMEADPAKEKSTTNPVYEKAPFE